MKKAALVFCGIFLCSSLSFAYPGWHEGKDMDKQERKEFMEKQRKEKKEYFNELEKLVEKYNKASDKKKEDVKKEIKALMSKETDKEIAFKKEKLAKMQERINAMETDKDSYLDKKVERVLSPEGQEKIKKMNNGEWPEKGKHKNKDGKHYKKDMI